MNPRAITIGIAAALAFVPPATHAQSTQAAIEAHLLKQELYLRDARQDKELKFDAAGNFLSSCSAPSGQCSVSFTLGGVDVTRVRLEPDRLVLEGTRVWLKFQPKMQRIHEGKISIEIEVPANGNYGPALDKIFAYGLADLT